MKVKVKSLSWVQLFATTWTVAHQAPLSCFLWRCISDFLQVSVTDHRSPLLHPETCCYMSTTTVLPMDCTQLVTECGRPTPGGHMEPRLCLWFEFFLTILLCIPQIWASLQCFPITFLSLFSLLHCSSYLLLIALPASAGYFHFPLEAFLINFLSIYSHLSVYSQRAQIKKTHLILLNFWWLYMHTYMIYNMCVIYIYTYIYDIYVCVFNFF